MNAKYKVINSMNRLLIFMHLFVKFWKIKVITCCIHSFQSIHLGIVHQRGWHCTCCPCVAQIMFLYMRNIYFLYKQIRSDSTEMWTKVFIQIDPNTDCLAYEYRIYSRICKTFDRVHSNDRHGHFLSYSSLKKITK